jgi:glucose/arabinose dehydrogenase
LAPTEAPTPEEVSTLPDPSIYNWQSVADGLERPVGLFNAGDGSGRLFVLEQPGTIRIIKEGEVLPTPFLDIVDRVGSGGSEQGLLGLAFHPNYAENGHFYVNYTDRNGNTVIARFSVSDNPDQADPASEVQLLGVEQPFGNHNGGMLAFGPDGYLYLGLGDGGSAGDPFGNAQSLSTLLGKILRIDVDDGDPYAIPPDNPFASGGGRPEIWAYGLRNPWRFSFDLLTNDLYIGDVGQNQWEEIDFLPAGSPGGANFGWNYREGAHPYEGSPPAGLNLIDPVAEYDHSQGCSVTGGYVYRGQDLPDWSGVYLYGDYCSGLVWGLLHLPDGSWQNARLFESGARITSFGQDQAGEIYLVDYQGGIYRLGKK